MKAAADAAKETVAFRKEIEATKKAAADAKKEAATFKKELENTKLELKCPTDLDLIKESEQMKTCKTLNAQSIPTICGGQDLTKANARAKIQSIGGNFDEVMAGGCLTEPQCDKIFDFNLKTARKRVKAVYGNKVSCPCA